MNYQNSTKTFNLRSPGVGNVLSSDEESRNSNIIENQLFGAIRMHSGGHGVIGTGVFVVITGSAGQYSVLCYEDKSSGRIPIQAFISQIYCFSESTLEWKGLSNNTTYYLFVRLIEAGDTQSSRLNKQVVTDFNTTGIIPTDGLLVAIVNVNEPGNSIVLTDVNGRVNLPVLGDHIVNNQNPHTPFLYQDDIVCSGLTILDYIRYRNLQVDSLIVSGNSIISGNITVLGPLIVSGNMYIQGNIVYNELQTQNLTIPGTFTAAYVEITSGMDVYGPSTFRKPVILTSGITIDGFDPSEAVPLITGQNADHLHSHFLGSISPGLKLINLSPEYPNTIISGEIESGIFNSIRLYNTNNYQWYSVTSGVAFVTTRVTLPQDFQSIDRLKVTTGVGYLGSGNNVTVIVLDKDLNPATVTGGVLSNLQMTQSNVTVSGGQLVPNQPMTLINRMFAVSGVATLLSDVELWYLPINGEKIVFDWNSSGANIGNHFDGLRTAPFDMRIETLMGSEYVALSGNTVIGLNVGNNGVEPSNIFATTPKLNLNAGASGSYFISASNGVTENNTINMGQLISVTADLVSSGLQNLNVQLICHRI